MVVCFSEELLDYFIDQRDTWKASYFRRAIDSSDLVLSAPYVQGQYNFCRNVCDVLEIKTNLPLIPYCSTHCLFLYLQIYNLTKVSNS